MSTALPFTLPASASFARRLPMAAATSATVAFSATSRIDPSGSCTFMFKPRGKTKDRAGRPCLEIIRVRISADDHRQGNERGLVVRVCPVVVVRFIAGAEYKPET